MTKEFFEVLPTFLFSRQGVYPQAMIFSAPKASAFRITLPTLNGDLIFSSIIVTGVFSASVDALSKRLRSANSFTFKYSFFSVS